MSEKEIDEQLIGFFATLQFQDAEFREWFIDVIKAKAHAGYDQTREHQRELTRQREQISVKLQTLLDLRMDGEVSADEYARKRQELYERQSAIALQLQVSDRDGRGIVGRVGLFEHVDRVVTQRDGLREVLDLVHPPRCPGHVRRPSDRAEREDEVVVRTAS